MPKATGLVRECRHCSTDFQTVLGLSVHLPTYSSHALHRNKHGFARLVTQSVKKKKVTDLEGICMDMSGTQVSRLPDKNRSTAGGTWVLFRCT